MSIYMIHLFDYDGECTLGYFATKEAAEHAAQYYNCVEPSSYGFLWEVEEYDLNDTDYAACLDAIKKRAREVVDKKLAAWKDATEEEFQKQYNIKMCEEDARLMKNEMSRLGREFKG